MFTALITIPTTDTAVAATMTAAAVTTTTTTTTATISSSVVVIVTIIIIMVTVIAIITCRQQMDELRKSFNQLVSDYKEVLDTFDQYKAEQVIHREFSS